MARFTHHTVLAISCKYDPINVAAIAKCKLLLMHSKRYTPTTD